MIEPKVKPRGHTMKVVGKTVMNDPSKTARRSLLKATTMGEDSPEMTYGYDGDVNKSAEMRRERRPTTGLKPFNQRGIFHSAERVMEEIENK